MSQEDQVELGRAIHTRRVKRFGTMAAAVRAADVNVETFRRAERGERIRADTLAKILRTLDPDSDGDWETFLNPPPDTAATSAAGDELTKRVTDDVIAEIVRRLGAQGRPGCID